jgi:hypothetical protein
MVIYGDLAIVGVINRPTSRTWGPLLGSGSAVKALES